MLTNTKIALAAALLFGTASAALAENDRDTTASEGQAAREWAEYLGQKTPGRMGNTGTSYGYFGSPTEQDFRKKNHNR